MPNLKLITVDVSALAPPEPMTVILTHLSTLTQQECLLVKHRRQPFPLYKKLEQAGFSYQCVIHDQDDISLYIYHKAAQNIVAITVAEMLAKNNINKGEH